MDERHLLCVVFVGLTSPPLKYDAPYWELQMSSDDRCLSVPALKTAPDIESHREDITPDLTPH